MWLYHRFSLSFRDVGDLLAERGITVTYETIRQWCLRFGPQYARRLKQRQGRLGDTWHLDELFITIQGCRQHLWRAIDQGGGAIDIFLQPRRDQRAAKRFFHKLLRGLGGEPLRLVTDKLRSYTAAHRTYGSTWKSVYILGGGTVEQYRETDRTPGEVIDNHHKPVAKRPPLEPRKRAQHRPVVSGGSKMLYVLHYIMRSFTSLLTITGHFPVVTFRVCESGSIAGFLTA